MMSREEAGMGGSSSTVISRLAVSVVGVLGPVAAVANPAPSASKTKIILVGVPATTDVSLAKDVPGALRRTSCR